MNVDMPPCERCGSNPAAHIQTDLCLWCLEDDRNEAAALQAEMRGEIERDIRVR